MHKQNSRWILSSRLSGANAEQWKWRASNTYFRGVDHGPFVSRLKSEVCMAFESTNLLTSMQNSRQYHAREHQWPVDRLHPFRNLCQSAWRDHMPAWVQAWPVKGHYLFNLSDSVEFGDPRVVFRLRRDWCPAAMLDLRLPRIQRQNEVGGQASWTASNKFGVLNPTFASFAMSTNIDKSLGESVIPLSSLVRFSVYYFSESSSAPSWKQSLCE